MNANDGVTAPPPIRFWIDPAYGAVQPIIARTVEETLRMAGWRSSAAQSRSDADIVYASDVTWPWRCATPQDWLTLSRSAPFRIGGLVGPEGGVVKASNAGEADAHDPIAAIYFFLTGRHEPGLEQAGEHVPGRRIADWGLLETPTVDRLVKALTSRMAEKGLAPERPRWPHGKTWALALSHDCDRPVLYDPASYLRDAAQFARQRQPARAGRAIAQALYCATMGLFRPDPYEEAMNDFMAFERSLGLKGSYYFGVWSRFEPDSTQNDLPYSHRSRKVVELARRVAAEGMEIGLHSSTLAWRSEARLRAEFERFENSYGRAPEGMRGHFWALEPGHEERTLGYVGGTGFVYDSSFGMNECHGFRRGTAYPFMPFDPETGDSCGVVSIPPIMMDDSLSDADPESWTGAFRGRVEDVRDVQGCLVLDWHSDTWRNPRWSAVTQTVMAELEEVVQADPTCWLASCGEIAAWAREGRWA